MKAIINSLSCLFLILTSFHSYASLFDRGNGFIYDDVLDITWLQDANYAETLGATPWYDYGAMNFENAKNWTDNLAILNHYNWRLPSAGENPSMGWYSFDSELGHMFYNNLGNSPGPITNTSFIDGSTGLNVEFQNVMNNFYWLDEVSFDDKAWSFKMQAGKMIDYAAQSSRFHLWLVHDGDIANSVDATVVPVPASAFLFGSALLGLIVTRRQANP